MRQSKFRYEFSRGMPRDPMTIEAVIPPSAASTDPVRKHSFAPVRPLPFLLSILLPLALLVPFMNKAYHIDDPLYLWSAKQILKNPFDYYGAIVNKWGT